MKSIRRKHDKIVAAENRFMTKVMIATPVSEDRKELFTSIPDADITFIDRACVTPEDIQDAEVILGNLPLSLLSECKNLKWVQLDSAGANTYSSLDENIVLTNASGAYGTAISEHMIGCALMVMKNLARYLDIQKEHEFINLGSVNTITSSKVLSVGMGDIGSNFAKKMNALGATVYGVRRGVHETPEYCAGMYTMDNMDEIIGECDIVALSLPETEETVHLFDEARFRKMKKGAILINVGRGSAIVTEDLLKIMREGYLSGACLDVTDPEPLPKNHPLWNTEHVYITPHISGRFNAAVTYDYVLNIMRTNLIHYLNNEPLEHVVNKKLGY